MKIKLSTGNRVGRDRRPHSRKVYVMWSVFWGFIAGLYGVALWTDTEQGPDFLSWIFLAVSVVYLAANLRILVQYKGRQVEWETHVREHNATMRARYAPDANPGMFDKEN